MMCGAAALSMVYQSFGLSVPQIAVWRLIATFNKFGRFQGHTYKMAMDAILRSFHAVVVKAMSPIDTLKAGLAVDVRAIMSHRPNPVTSNNLTAWCSGAIPAGLSGR
jgi:hypothetical protein